MVSLFDDKEAEIIQLFKFTSRHVDDPYFEGWMGPIHPDELPLNKANASDTEAPFLAPLSRRLWGSVQDGKPPSSVRRPSTLSNDFSSDTTGSNVTKFHV